VKRKLTFLRALCELDNLVVRTCFSVFKWSELSSVFSFITQITDVFSVAELNKCAFCRLHLLSWFMEILKPVFLVVFCILFCLVLFCILCE